MTDDEDLEPPPRQWPPLSVWFAAALLAGPPVLVAAMFVAHDRRPEVVLFPLLWVLTAVVNALRLLVGVPSGIRWAAVLLVLLALCVGATAAGMLLGGATAGAVGAAVPLVYVVTVAGFLWWPATRIWCGWLPPSEPDDEDAP